MKNFSHIGNTCSFVLAAAVASGAGFQVGSMFAVANTDGAQGATIEGDVVGVFDLPKSNAAGTAATAGTKLYWDNTNKVVTKTATNNLFIGHLLKDAADADLTFHMRLHGAPA